MQLAARRPFARGGPGLDQNTVSLIFPRGLHVPQNSPPNLSGFAVVAKIAKMPSLETSRLSWMQLMGLAESSTRGTCGTECLVGEHRCRPSGCCGMRPAAASKGSSTVFPVQGSSFDRNGAAHGSRSASPARKEVSLTYDYSRCSVLRRPRIQRSLCSMRRLNPYSGNPMTDRAIHVYGGRSYDRG